MVQPWAELSVLDRPEILQFIFYPRRDAAAGPGRANAMACSVPVEQGVSISCWFYYGDEGYPNVLLFHGNGEVASDYADIGSIYNQIGCNLFVADYRGYGTSGGQPTLTSVIRDAHPLFDAFRRELKEKGFSGSLFIMGRSLGSISAIELGYHYQSQLAGLIVESGFADVFNLFEHLGFPASAFGPAGMEVPTGIQLVRKISIPALVMHGEHDRIVPLQEGMRLYDNIATNQKRFLMIPGVDHNTIFLGGMEEYLQALKDFVAANS